MARKPVRKFPPPPPKDIFAYRVWWIVKSRILTVCGDKMTMGSLGRRAGLAKGHVFLIIKRGAMGAMPGTISRLSWAGQVSRNWLATGLGSPDDPDIFPDPPNDA